MTMSFKALFRLLVPLGLLLIAAYSTRFLSIMPPSGHALIQVLPYFMAGLAVFNAMQINRGRLLAAASLLCACTAVFSQIAREPFFTATFVNGYVGVALAAPVVGIILLLIPEKGVKSRYGLLYGAFPVMAVLGSVMLAEKLGISSWQSAWLLPAVRRDFMLPPAAIILHAAATLSAVALLLLQDDEIDAILLALLLAVSVSLGWIHVEGLAPAVLAAGGLAIVLSGQKISVEKAFRDKLTGLRNRASLEEKFRTLGKRYSVAMLDIDHFKKFNDTYGHDVGDDVLKIVASYMDQVTGGGTAYRYGGEEFCVVFLRKSLEQCIIPLEAVRKSIENHKIVLRDHASRPESHEDGEKMRGDGEEDESVSVTISLGLAERKGPMEPADVMKASDELLYVSKDRGRNCLTYTGHPDI